MIPYTKYTKKDPKKPKKFGELFKEEQENLVLALREGKTIQALALHWDGPVWRDIQEIRGWNAEIAYRVKPEETKEPKTFGELSEVEQGALLLAHHKGETIQLRFNTYTWEDIPARHPVWADVCTYRVKPKPVVSKEDLGILLISKNPEETMCLRVSGEYTEDVLDVTSIKVEVIPDV